MQAYINGGRETSQRRFKVYTFFEWNCENRSLARISGENKIKTQKGKKSQPLKCVLG